MRFVTIIIRLVQLLAILPIGLGLSNAGAFFELLSGLTQGQAWDYAEFAKRLAAFSSPTGLGVALIVGLELILRRGRTAHARSLLYPERPWLWNPMWAERRIRVSNRTAIALCLASLGIFVSVIVPVGLWMASQKLATPIYIGLGIVGLFVLALWRMTWLNRRWGRSELEILTLPGVIGGPFRGTVVLSEALPEGTALRMTLNCIRQRTVRMYPSRDRQTTTDTIWQDQKILVTALPMSQRDGVAIPCSFAIPFSCEPTTLDTIGFSSTPDPDPDVHISIYWQLSVGMKDPLDLRAVTFEIPVFRTESSSPNYKEDVTVDAPYVEPVDISALLDSLPLRREYSASGKRLRFSMMPHRDFLFMVVFTLAVTLGVWAILYYASMPIALFAAFLPVFLAIACYTTLVQALTWKAQIEITATTTTFTAGYPWSRRRYEFRRARMPQLECHPEFRRQSGSTTYCVRLLPAEGSPCILAKRLESKQTATAVREWLMKELGTA